LLQWVKATLRFQSLDGRDLSTDRILGELQASVDRPAILKNGARAAFPQVSAFLGAGEAQILAQHQQQQ
jgi:hypothetical protein